MKIDSKRELLAVAIITIFSAVAAIVIYEWWVRADLKSRIEQHFAIMPLWLQNQTLVPSPGDTDYDAFRKVKDRVIYRPNARYDLAAELGGKTVLDFSVQTNNAGLLSERPLNEKRPADSKEYRILVYGDSLTGTVTANYQWVDTIEDLLNAWPDLARALRVDRFKVVNLGWVAAGFGRFWIAHERIGHRLDGDLIIVNFTYDDFPRRTEAPRYSVPSERAEMIANAANVIGKFVGTKIPVLVTQMPIYDEIWPNKVDYEMTAEVAGQFRGIRFVDMRKRLPIDRGVEFGRALYNVPYDHHMSDLGGEYYARAMASLIAEHLTGKTVDFSTTKTKYYDPTLCHRDVEETVSECIARPKGLTKVRTVLASRHNIAELRGFVLNNLGRAKTASFRPYFIDTVFHGIDPLIPPHDKPMAGGFVEVPLSALPQSNIRLNIFCTSGEVSAHNSACYTNQHFFVD